MKIMLVDPDALEPTPDIKVFADSALSPGDKPLFIPDAPPQGWEGMILPAVRVDRLGTSIATRFANRYYAHVTAVHLLRPAGPWPEIYRSMDHALSLGRWMPTDGRRAFDISDGTGTVTADLDLLRADEAISALSRLMTLKMGDVIIFNRPPIMRPPVPDTTLRVTVDGVEAIRFNLK